MAALDAALRKGLRPFYAWIDEIALTDYKVRIVDGIKGAGARTRVLIESSDSNVTWGTVGVSDNIIEASWQALVDSYEYFGLKFRSAPRRNSKRASTGQETPSGATDARRFFSVSSICFIEKILPRLCRLKHFPFP